jgi:hypothetical protein
MLSRSLFVVSGPRMTARQSTIMLRLLAAILGMLALVLFLRGTITTVTAYPRGPGRDCGSTLENVIGGGGADPAIDSADERRLVDRQCANTSRKRFLGYGAAGLVVGSIALGTACRSRRHGTSTPAPAG